MRKGDWVDVSHTYHTHTHTHTHPWGVLEKKVYTSTMAITVATASLGMPWHEPVRTRDMCTTV